MTYTASSIYYFNSVKCAITSAFVNGRFNSELVHLFKSTKSRDILHSLNKSGRLTRFQVLRILCIVRYYKVALSILNDSIKRSLDVRTNYTVEVCVEHARSQVNFINLEYKQAIVKCAEKFMNFNKQLIKLELRNSDTLSAIQALAHHIELDVAYSVFEYEKLIEPTKGLYDKYIKPEEDWQYLY